MSLAADLRRQPADHPALAVLSALLLPVVAAALVACRRAAVVPS